MLSESFVVGGGTARFVQGAVDGPSTLVFGLLALLAVLGLVFGQTIEGPMLWKELFAPQSEDLRRIGGRSTRLVGAPPPPITLGIALSLLVVLLW